MKLLAHAVLPITAALWAGIVVINYLAGRSLDGDLVDLGSVD